METIPHSDSAWIQAFSPIAWKKKNPPKFSGKLGAYGSTILFVERNVKKIRETLSKRQTGHCITRKVALVPCLVPSPPTRLTQVTLGCIGKAVTMIRMPDLPNFYLANKSNVLLLVFGINTWLESLKIWLLLPIKEKEFQLGNVCLGERIEFPLYLLSASAADLSYLASSLSRCLNVGILATQLYFICR